MHAKTRPDVSTKCYATSRRGRAEGHAHPLRSKQGWRDMILQGQQRSTVRANTACRGENCKQRSAVSTNCRPPKLPTPKACASNIRCTWASQNSRGIGTTNKPNEDQTQGNAQLQSHQHTTRNTRPTRPDAQLRTLGDKWSRGERQVDGEGGDCSSRHPGQHATSAPAALKD